ncbi:MAG: Bro-N domain-containing protein [Holosporales bacterium]|jgi:prophage antirepressor-like protein|nr:Bro-N domain-containing protein [Holosporales bacterium]
MATSKDISPNNDTKPAHQDVLFENVKVRRMWHEEQWYYSVVDVVGILTESEYQTARKYWNKLTERLKTEGVDQLVTICHRLKLPSSDGKSYFTDCANTKGLLRIIQSIPSKKAEPFKQWLAKVGHERLQEISDPALAVDRARDYWQQHGRSEKWIQQRMMGQETRNKLTDYWKDHEIKEGEEFAILTNIIHQEWTGLSVKNHKELKGLSTQNLRDHMSEEELIFTALAELSTRKIAETEKATGLSENKVAAKKGGNVAKNARVDLEKEIGKKVVSDHSFIPKKLK